MNEAYCIFACEMERKARRMSYLRLQIFYRQLEEFDKESWNTSDRFMHVELRVFCYVISCEYELEAVNMSAVIFSERI